MNAVGMVVRPSRHDGPTTAARLLQFVETRHFKVFARIDHAGAAAEVGLELPFTQVLIFGNPRAGTPLMHRAPGLGIDLPLRVLVWEDAAGHASIGYDDPQWVAARHGLLPEDAAAFAALRQLLADAAMAATSLVP